MYLKVIELQNIIKEQMVIASLISSLALAIATIFQRTILKLKRIDIKEYQSAEFLAIVLATLPFLYFLWEVKSEAFATKNIIIFLLVVFFSIIANLLVYYSMKWEKVTNIEPAKVLEPLFVVLLAVIFSKFVPDLYETNSKIIFAGIISGLALTLSHLKKHHLEFNKYFIAAIAGSFFFALELVLSRLILDYYSAMTFYFLRCASILLVSLILFKPNFKEFNSKLKLKIALIGVLWVVYRIAMYYSYIHIGIVLTTLILMSGPIFIYIFAWIFLKEKICWRNIVASLIIITCIIYVTI